MITKHAARAAWCDGNRTAPGHRMVDVAGSSHVSMARIPRRSPPAVGAPVRAGEIARRAEPPPCARHVGAQRRRSRLRLVRPSEHPRPVPERRPRLGRGEPGRGGRGGRVSPLPGPRPRRHRHPGATDQLPPLPLPALAVRPQRLHRRVRVGAARVDARRPPGPVQPRPGLDGLGADVLPGADLRAARGPRRRFGADGGVRRGVRTRAGDRGAAADDRRADRRGAPVPPVMRVVRR